MKKYLVTVTYEERNGCIYSASLYSRKLYPSDKVIVLLQEMGIIGKSAKIHSMQFRATSTLSTIDYMMKLHGLA